MSVRAKSFADKDGVVHVAIHGVDIAKAYALCCLQDFTSHPWVWSETLVDEPVTCVLCIANQT